MEVRGDLMVIYCHEKQEGQCGVGGFAPVFVTGRTKSGQGYFSSCWAKPCSTGKDGTSVSLAVVNPDFNLFYRTGYFCMCFCSI